MVEVYFLFFFGMRACAVSAPRLFNIYISLMISCWIQSFWVKLSFTSWSNSFICISVFHIFCHAKLCTNDYSATNYISAKGNNTRPFFLWKENRWGRAFMVYLFSGEFLGVQALIFRFFDLNDALQRANSVVWLSHSDSYYRYRCFLVVDKCYMSSFF